MTDNERKAVEKVSKQIKELESLKAALELGNPSVTISAGALKFGSYTEKSVRIKDMTLRLVDRLLKTKWHVLAHLIGEPTLITGNDLTLQFVDYQFMQVQFTGMSNIFVNCNFRYAWFTNDGFLANNTFHGCDFTGAIFSWKEYQWSLDDVDFSDCCFDDTTLRGVSFIGAILDGTSWNRAHIGNARFFAEYKSLIRSFTTFGDPQFFT